jgi:2-C-methyl-D-erythritol 2,4-cyclodiphosphate synthase
MYRIGYGTDIHRHVEGRPLIVGGVTIESDVGADGHSDADVLIHALTDALFGAIAEGDIGNHFPDTEDRWRNAESFVFLKYAYGLVTERGFSIANIDSVLHLENIKLRPYIDAMRENIAAALELTVHEVSVKAKTSEKLDAVGEGRAIRAEAIVLLERSPR